MVENSIKRFLLNHGLSQEEIDSKSPEELKAIYTQGISTLIQRFSDQDTKEVQKVQNPFKNLKNPEEIFDLMPDFFEYLTLEDVILMISKQFRHIPMDHIQKIVSILFFSFQENILQEIENKLINISQDECHSIMEIYESQRNNISHLIEINQKLELESFRKKLEDILKLKSLIEAHKEEK